MKTQKPLEITQEYTPDGETLEQRCALLLWLLGQG